MSLKSARAVKPGGHETIPFPSIVMFGFWEKEKNPKNNIIKRINKLFF